MNVFLTESILITVLNEQRVGENPRFFKTGFGKLYSYSNRNTYGDFIKHISL